MSLKGGYQILDFKNVSLADGTAKTIPGVYDTLEGNYDKAVMLSGLQIGSATYPAIMPIVEISGTNYVITLAGIGTITITSEDSVTLAVPES